MYKGLFYTFFYATGIMHGGVLIEGDVFILGVSLKRGFPLYIHIYLLVQTSAYMHTAKHVQMNTLVERVDDIFVSISYT